MLFAPKILDSSMMYSYKIIKLQSYFIDQVALTRKQQKDLLVFETSCHMPTFLPHTVKTLHCRFNGEHQAGFPVDH